MPTGPYGQIWKQPELTQQDLLVALKAARPWLAEALSSEDTAGPAAL